MLDIKIKAEDVKGHNAAFATRFMKKTLYYIQQDCEGRMVDKL